MSVKTDKTLVCQFCGVGDCREEELGKLHEKNGIVVHYYCLVSMCTAVFTVPVLSEEFMVNACFNAVLCNTGFECVIKKRIQYNIIFFN